MPSSRLAALALILGALSGMGCCAATNQRSHAELRMLHVVTDPGANRDSATRLDVVVIYDLALLSSLPKTAPAWFAGKQALVDIAPDALSVVSLELPPALPLRPVTLPEKAHRAVAVRAYAGYQDVRGQHALDLTGKSDATLRLRTSDVIVEPLQKK